MPSVSRKQQAFRLFGLAVLAGLLALGASGQALAAPTAPAPLSPAASASVTIPFTISWSAASDPSGILAYNWQVSATSTFAKIARQSSVMAPATQDSVSGLAPGSYFWRVQAVSNDFVQGPWSAARAVQVTGTGAAPQTPTLNQPRGGNSFHPWESFGMSWSGVPGAVKYVLEASKDPAFPVNGVVFQWESPTPSTDILITTVDRGSYSARVFAVDANGNYSMPSNVIGFTIAFNAPVAAAPTLVSPTGGGTQSMPVDFRWNHIINPQSSSYELQIARDAGFSQIEDDIPFLNGPSYTVITLPTAGPKFWRVRSQVGVVDTAGTAAVTAWSATGTFTIADVPPRVTTMTLSRPTPAAGQEVFIDLQLNRNVPPSGGTISLSSSNPQVAPLPASVAVQGSTSWVQTRFITGQVDTPTTVSMTATIGSESTTQTFTVVPSSLHSLDGMPGTQNGGVPLGAIVMLNGQAPAGGAVVSLSSSSPAAQPPATVTVPAGVESVSFSFPTSQVSSNTPVTITATWRGASVQASTTLTPQPAPTSITLDPTTTSGSSGSNGRVTAADPRNADITFTLSSSRPDIVLVPGSVTVPQFAAAGGFIISTRAVSTRTLVDISVSGGGVTLTATLTLDPFPSSPPPAPTVAALGLSPSTVTAGTGSTGTVTISAAAPSGGMAVSLSSSSSAASVPASVTVPAGSTTASFAVSTSSAGSPTITATGGGTSQSAVLTVNAAPPPPAAPTVSGLALSPSTVTVGAGSTGTVTISAAAPSGGMAVSLSSSSSAASVPASVTVPAGSTTASFAVSTSSAGSPTVTATGGGTSRSAVLTVNASSPPPGVDTVTITRAEWSGGRLRVEARSSGSGATLTVYVTSTGVKLGTISDGRFETNTASNPGNVTVKSSLGGQASRAIP